MTSVLQENINGVRVVKAFANEPYELKNSIRKVINLNVKVKN